MKGEKPDFDELIKKTGIDPHEKISVKSKSNLKKTTIINREKIKDNIPRVCDPVLFKDQNFPEVAEMLSYREFCGKCGKVINPEGFSNMWCRGDHKLEQVGIYRIAEGHKTKGFYEGWIKLGRHARVEGESN